MTMSNDEACTTLLTLDKLICIAELMGLRDPEQRAALGALRGRRAALRQLISKRRKLKTEKIVCLAAWREAPSMAALAL